MELTTAAIDAYQAAVSQREKRIRDLQAELVGRYRIATTAERQFVRESVRRHVEENFPELEAP